MTLATILPPSPEPDGWMIRAFAPRAVRSRSWAESVRLRDTLWAIFAARCNVCSYRSRDPHVRSGAKGTCVWCIARLEELQ